MKTMKNFQKIEGVTGFKKSLEETELKIELYPENVPKDLLKKNSPMSNMPVGPLVHSLDEKKKLAFCRANVPVLDGFYSAHCNHYPIRIKPDDIWLLIVQAFSNHVSANYENLRKYFVNFDDQKPLLVKYPGVFVLENVDKKILEDFSIQINEQMKKYLGEELLETLTSNFSTTNYDSLIISKLSIMGAFKNYFIYEMTRPICGIPYIILEGTKEDYQNIKEKAEKLRKYKFDWYINRIIPHIQKMIDAKKGKIDNNYFRDIIKKNQVLCDVRTCLPGRKEKELKNNITGWILDFFTYKKRGDDTPEKFDDKSLKVTDFNRLAGQMLNVPFTINDEITGKIYEMEYNVGFIGCDQNEKKEVFPVQAWEVSIS